MSANREMIKEVKVVRGAYKVVFQKAKFSFEDRDEYGFCFDWQDEKGRSVTGRGRTRIPSEKILLQLLAKAYGEGWFNPLNDIEDITTTYAE